MDRSANLDSAAGHPTKVLVIDDDAMVLRSIARTLAAHHEVRAVDRARAALELLRSGARFDAIVCDLMMPDMTGAELHAELLRFFPDQASRFALLTGGGFSAAAQVSLEAC